MLRHVVPRGGAGPAGASTRTSRSVGGGAGERDGSITGRLDAPLGVGWLRSRLALR
jgi:hypothetical protein